jgi:hypothetical protein
MPDPREYLKGYGLHNGLVLSGHQLTSIDLKHETVKTYREYRYPIVMFWKNIDSKYTSSDLVAALDRQVTSDRTIYTRYGNPYSCHFGNLDHHYQDGDHLVVNSIGYCQRI